MADRKFALIGHSHDATSEVNDLTASVTWANVPDANITESSVTQHQAALTITESQISDLGSYLTSVVASNVNAEASTDGWVLTSDGAGNAAWEVLPSGGLSNVVEDLTPQLGGNLDLNSKTVNGTGTIGITGAITATSFGGITSANLLDKSAAESISGDWDWQDNKIIRPELDDYCITDANATVSANAVTLTYSTAQSYELDLEAATGNVTVTISGGPPTNTYGEMIVKVQQDTTADRTLTWAGGTFVWPAATEVEPKTGSDAITIYYLSTWDGGTTWYINGVEYG